MTKFNEYYKLNRKKNPLRWPDVDVVRLVSKASPHPGGGVLDLGCGEGRNVRFLIDCGHQPLCVDSSGEALSIAQELYSLDDNKIVHSDAISALEKMDDSTFDLVLCWGLSHYVDDTKSLLSNIRRVIKDDGSLIMSFSATDDQRERADDVKKLFSDVEVQKLMDENTFTIQDFGKTTMNDYKNNVIASYFWVRAVAANN